MTELDINQYMEKDTIRVAGQEYAIISIISPKSRQKYDNLAVKIKGVFSKMEEAKEYCAKLQKMDDTFDMFVVEMYSWLCLPPDLDKISDKNYGDQQLHELITEHDKEMENAKMEFEKHKREQMKAGKLQPVIESKTDESKTDESKTDESKTDESKTDESLENID